jgi:hypothetical protein
MNQFVPLIAKMHLLKQEEAECNKDAAETWYLPALALPEPRLQELDRVGFDFSREHLEFLCAANGWKSFFIFTDVFSIEQLLLENLQDDVFIRDGFLDYLKTKGLSKSDVFVFGSSDRDADVFLLISESATTLPGGVIWYALQEVEVFQSFYYFFLYMIEMQALLTKRTCRKN